MKISKIRPIPKKMVERIKQYDLEHYRPQNGYLRFYAYLTKNDGELVKVTVAVKNRYKKWYCKQVAVHGIDSERAFVKDIKKCTIGGYSVGWYAEGLSKYRSWYESDKWDWQYDRYLDPHAAVINIEYVLEQPEFKYSAADLYIKHDDRIIQYLRICREYPQAEYLLKLGYKHFATSKTILRRVGTDKAFCRWLIRNQQIKTGWYYVETLMEAYKTNRPIDEVQKFMVKKKEFNVEKSYAPIRKLFRGKLLEKYFDYIKKQHISSQLYLDYLIACQALQIDMSLDKNRFPHDFMRWHDIRTDEYASLKAELDAKKREEFYAQFRAVAEKYLSLQNYQNEGYLILIAKSPAELVNEGKALDHCVGRMNYDQRFVREESLIFFVRQVSAPDIPFVTVEYSLQNKRVLQCYGEHDHRPSDKVLSFVQGEWLPFANHALKQIAA